MYPKWVKLINGNMGQNLPSISWWFIFAQTTLVRFNLDPYRFFFGGGLDYRKKETVPNYSDLSNLEDLAHPFVSFSAGFWVRRFEAPGLRLRGARGRLRQGGVPPAPAGGGAADGASESGPMLPRAVRT